MTKSAIFRKNHRFDLGDFKRSFFGPKKCQKIHFWPNYFGQFWKKSKKRKNRIFSRPHLLEREKNKKLDFFGYSTNFWPPKRLHPKPKVRESQISQNEKTVKNHDFLHLCLWGPFKGPKRNSKRRAWSDEDFSQKPLSGEGQNGPSLLAFDRVHFWILESLGGFEKFQRIIPGTLKEPKKTKIRK